MLRRALIILLSILLVSIAQIGQVQAKYASIVIDAKNGETLHAVNADTKNYPASLTKMMTLYLLFEAIEQGKVKYRSYFLVSRRASAKPASKLGLKPNEKISVKDCILALVVKSANDVASVVAENLAGTEKGFAKMMTKKARQLGMKNSYFKNASGLPNKGQLSTARDLSIMAHALITGFPQYYKFFSTREFSFKGKKYKNHNKFLKKYPGADGIKTGYIRSSGYNLAASASKNGRRLIAIVTGAKNPKQRDRHIATLLNKSFQKILPDDPVTIKKPVATKTKKPVATKTKKSVAAKKRQIATIKKPMIKNNANWEIQVGAFKTFTTAYNTAKKAKKRIPSINKNAHIFVEPVTKNSETFYRAKIKTLTKMEAIRSCKRLKKNKFRCVYGQIRK